MANHNQLNDLRLSDDLKRVHECFNSFSSDFNYNLSIILQTLGEIAGAICTTYSRKEDSKIVVEATWDAPPIIEKCQDGVGIPCYELIDKGIRTPQILKDISKHPLLKDGPYVNDCEVKAILLFPVMCCGEVEGSLCVLLPHEISKDDKLFTLGQLMANAIGTEQLRKSSEDKLQAIVDKRVKYERLVNEVTQEALKRQPKSKLIQFILRRIGETLDVSRVYFFKYDRDSGTVSNKYEWAGKGIKPFKDKLQNIPVDDFPMWRDEMLALRSVCVEDVSKLEDSKLKDLLLLQNVKTTLNLPFAVFSTPYGFLGFDECRYIRRWKAEDIDLLKTVCWVLSQTLEKERWEKQIIAMECTSAMGSLAGAVAHEINNPLQGMLLHLDNVKQNVKEDRKATKSFEYLQDGIQRISEIVLRILELHREQINTTKIDLNDVVKGVMTLLEGPLKHNSCHVGLNLADNLPEITGIRHFVHQAILNVLVNAMESLEKGVSIDIGSKLEKGFVVLEIKDNGIGISKEDLPHIFEPFFSLKGQKSPGLGLFIAHTIMAGQGGSISVDSKEGKGTKVSLRFHKNS